MLLNPVAPASKIEAKSIAIPSVDTSDEQLIQQVRGGNPNAYGGIMRRYNQQLFRVVRSIVKNDSDALDIVQEAHIKAYTKINEFKGEGRFLAWLATIARNEALMHLRKTKREVAMPENDLDQCDSPFETLVKSVPGPDAALQNKELKALINHNIDMLPSDFRSVFVLRAVDQFSVRETADILDIKPETVKTRLFRARRLLRQQIQTELEKAGMQVYEVGGIHCDQIVISVMSRIQATSFETPNL